MGHQLSSILSAGRRDPGPPQQFAGGMAGPGTQPWRGGGSQRAGVARKEGQTE